MVVERKRKKARQLLFFVSFSFSSDTRHVCEWVVPALVLILPLTSVDPKYFFYFPKRVGLPHMCVTLVHGFRFEMGGRRP